MYCIDCALKISPSKTLGSAEINDYFINRCGNSVQTRYSCHTSSVDLIIHRACPCSHNLSCDQPPYLVILTLILNVITSGD